MDKGDFTMILTETKMPDEDREITFKDIQLGQWFKWEHGEYPCIKIGEELYLDIKSGSTSSTSVFSGDGVLLVSGEITWYIKY